MAERTENKSKVIRQEIEKDFTNMGKFEILEYQLAMAIRRMWAIQERLDKFVYSSKKFMYEPELDALIIEVERITKEIRLIQLKDERFNQMVLMVLVVSMFVLMYRFFTVY